MAIYNASMIKLKQRNKNAGMAKEFDFRGKRHAVAFKKARVRGVECASGIFIKYVGGIL